MAFACAVEPDVRSSPVAHSKLAAAPSEAEEGASVELDAGEPADDAEVAALLLDDEAVLLSEPQADSVSAAASAAAPASRRLVRAIFTQVPPGTNVERRASISMHEHTLG